MGREQKKKCGFSGCENKHTLWHDESCEVVSMDGSGFYEYLHTSWCVLIPTLDLLRKVLLDAEITIFLNPNMYRLSLTAMRLASCPWG